MHLSTSEVLGRHKQLVKAHAQLSKNPINAPHAEKCARARTHTHIYEHEKETQHPDTPLCQAAGSTGFIHLTTLLAELKRC